MGIQVMKKSLLLLSMALSMRAADFPARFEEIRKSASPEQLYAFLYALPKGGDLHHHSGLSAFASTWYDAATSERTLRRNSFFTRVDCNVCDGAEDPSPRFTTIQRSTYDQRNGCQKAQFQPLESLSPALKQEWLSSLVLDRPGEGRDEFFERIVKRFGGLFQDPYLVADVMSENMRLFGAEGVRYIEAQFPPFMFRDPKGQTIPPEEANRILTERARESEAPTGVTIRFQRTVIRFRPDAEQRLEEAYGFVARHRDQWVGINMAGREDNDKGFALRFLPIFREMRAIYSDVPLSIHGGEKDNPGREVRDTLLLGATRIGHGVNLISDPDTMLLMRNNRYLVEINLISNRLLEYVPDTSKHPFPEYLRTGIPVCLNTDDRGSFDSNMTDEYFTAVTTFHLSWQEVVQLGRDSLRFSFAGPELKRKLLDGYDAAIRGFETRFGASDWKAALSAIHPMVSGYAHRTWNIHK